VTVPSVRLRRAYGRRWSRTILLVAVAARAYGQVPVQVATLIQPDTVRVGDAFHVAIAVRAPAGASIVFPRVLDSTATVQSLDPGVVKTITDGKGVRADADYRVAAWDVGRQPIVLGYVIVRLGGVERRVPIAGYAVNVTSVLPADSAKRVPKPARPLVEPTVIPWWVWALLAAALAVGALLWWWWSHRGPPKRALATTAPYERAMREFARVEALALLEAGERGRYVALTVEVVRGYLADRFTTAGLSLTTVELVTAMESLDTVPYARLLGVLGDADLIKFAKQSVTPERARELARESRAIVDAEHAASAPALEAAA
jgi:hypothetical protein